MRRRHWHSVGPAAPRRLRPRLQGRPGLRPKGRPAAPRRLRPRRPRRRPPSSPAVASGARANAPGRCGCPRAHASGCHACARWSNGASRVRRRAPPARSTWPSWRACSRSFRSVAPLRSSGRASTAPATRRASRGPRAARARPGARARRALPSAAPARQPALRPRARRGHSSRAWAPGAPRPGVAAPPWRTAHSAAPQAALAAAA